MKTEIKQQWVQALRSNEYSQAQGNLRSSEGFCCLGVLCDVYAKETGDEWDVMQTTDKTPISYYKMKDQHSVLPDCVVEWSGLGEQNPFVHLYDNPASLTTLTTLNDSGKTFEEIAQLIEGQL